MAFPTQLGYIVPKTVYILLKKAYFKRKFKTLYLHVLMKSCESLEWLWYAQMLEEVITDCKLVDIICSKDKDYSK